MSVGLLVGMRCKARHAVLCTERDNEGLAITTCRRQSPGMTSVGVIGVGNIGQEHIIAFREAAGAEVVAVADANAEAAASVAEEFEIPQHFGSGVDLIACGEVEAVVVATPNRAGRAGIAAAEELSTWLGSRRGGSPGEGRPDRVARTGACELVLSEKTEASDPHV